LIDVNICFSDVLCTPLIFAAKQKNGLRFDMVKILIQPRDSGSKVDINAADKNGRTALTYASFFGDYESVKILIESNANVNMNLENSNLNKKPESPLFYAKLYGHQKVVSLLLQNGAIDKEVPILSKTKSPNLLSHSAPIVSEQDLTVPPQKDRSSFTLISKDSMGYISSSVPKNPKYRTSPSPRIKNPTRSGPRISETQMEADEDS